MSDKTAIINTLIEHTDWDFTDLDNDQIVCNCHWTSKAFTPRSYGKAVEVFAEHQTDYIIKALSSKTI